MMNTNLNRIFFLLILFLSGISVDIFAVTLEVGPGKPYATPSQAAQDANPGDTVLIFPSTYSGGNFIGDLHGNSSELIYFIGVDVETVIFSGGSQGLHFSEVSYIKIANLSFTLHTGNAMNIDDGGTFETPTHHIYIENCKFYNMGASGNNDFLKMSGVDDFEVWDCSFETGAAGGSGIDMVGCHEGWFHHNTFNDMGSNCIQAKGGTRFIVISHNWFENGGQRSLNLGGSTGLEFFRPQDATFEAADLDVYANIFIGSTAPIAYVGCVRVHVVNNTIITPGNWVIRILQETVDPERFEPCGDNSFVNNLVFYTDEISTHVNVGGNTAPETFLFSNNLWYNASSPGNSTPDLPVSESNPVIGQNPGFEDENTEDFHLTLNSPAKDAGVTTSFNTDYEGNVRPQGAGFDIGAFEFPGFLAVDWADFHLERDKSGSVDVKWSTIFEQNSMQFEVMRSPTGERWESVASVSATENSRSANNYEWTDSNPLNGLSYYRIQETDLEGVEHFSKILSHFKESDGKSVLCYPNPFKSHLDLTADLFLDGEIFIRDTTGRIFYQQKTGVEDGRQVRLDLEHLPSGMYVLEYGDKYYKVLKD
jgi:pectate lyase